MLDFSDVWSGSTLFINSHSRFYKHQYLVILTCSNLEDKKVMEFSCPHVKGKNGMLKLNTNDVSTENQGMQ